MTRRGWPAGLTVALACGCVVVCGCLSACGGAGRRTAVSISTGARAAGANPILGFGRAANAAEWRAIAALLQRYDDAAAAGDGRSACALIYPVLAAAIAKSEGQNNAVLLGSKTCPEAMSRLFRYLHRELIAARRVVAVRIGGDHADVVLAIAGQPRGLMEVKRYANTWMIDRMVSGVLP